MNPTQRVLTAQMEALQLVEAIHENDIQNFKDSYYIAHSTPEDLARALATIAELVMTLDDHGAGFTHRLNQLRKMFRRQGDD